MYPLNRKLKHFFMGKKPSLIYCFVKYYQLSALDLFDFQQKMTQAEILELFGSQPYKEAPFYTAPFQSYRSKLKKEGLWEDFMDWIIKPFEGVKI